MTFIFKFCIFCNDFCRFWKSKAQKQAPVSRCRGPDAGAQRYLSLLCLVVLRPSAFPTYRSPTRSLSVLPIGHHSHIGQMQLQNYKLFWNKVPLEQKICKKMGIIWKIREKCLSFQHQNNWGDAMYNYSSFEGIARLRIEGSENTFLHSQAVISS